MTVHFQLVNHLNLTDAQHKTAKVRAKQQNSVTSLPMKTPEMRGCVMILRNNRLEIYSVLVFLLLAFMLNPVRAQEEGTESLFPDLDIVSESESDSENLPTESEAGNTTANGTSEKKALTLDEAIQEATQLIAAERFLEAVARYTQILNAPQGHGNVRALLGRGKAFYELRYYDLALKSFDSALARSPSNPIGLNERGKLYMDIENYREATEDFERAVETLPTDTEFLSNYGKALIQYGQQDAGLGNLDANKNIEKGVGSLTTVIETLNALMGDESYRDERKTIVIELADTHFERGLGNSSLGRTGMAIEDLERAHELAPENIEYTERLGATYFESATRAAAVSPDDSESIISDYSRAISILKESLEKVEGAGVDLEDMEGFDSQSPFTGSEKMQQQLVRIASAHLELGKYVPESQREAHYRAAIEASQSVLDLDPKQVTALVFQGTAHRMLGNLQKAVDLYTEALITAPGFAGEARFRRGIVWYYLDELDLAMQDFSRSQEDPRADFWRGVIYLKQKKFDKAVQFFTDSINRNPVYVLSYANRGKAYLNTGDFQRALNDFNQIIRREPDQAKGYFLRGIACELLEQRKNAIESYEKALEWDPDHARASQTLAKLRAE